MTKNLLKQVMVKEAPKPKKKESEFKLDGLVTKINSGYTINNDPKHQIKKTFAPSTLSYNHGECPRYWYLAFSGAIYEDKSDAFGVANRTNGTYGHKRIQDALIKSGVVKVFQEEDKETAKIRKQQN